MGKKRPTLTDLLMRELDVMGFVGGVSRLICGLGALLWWLGSTQRQGSSRSGIRGTNLSTMKGDQDESEVVTEAQAGKK